jgi:hypothetical protein
MLTVEMLEAALALAERIGYRTRYEWLGGVGGGGCELKGQKWLFVDLALDPSEQLQQVLEALRRESPSTLAPVPEELRPLLPVSRSA